MLTLWGRSDSTNVRKVLWCLNELNLEFTHIQAGGSFGIIESEEYLKLNPNGLVPSLKDEDTILWESNTILRYLAEKYGQHHLYIHDIAQRYGAEKWMDWCLSSITPIFRILILNSLKLPIEQRNPQLLEQARTDFNHKLQILDQHLCAYPFIGGTQFSVADIVIACYVLSWKNLPIIQAQSNKLPHLEKWFERLSTRSAFQKLFKK